MLSPIVFYRGCIYNLYTGRQIINRGLFMNLQEYFETGLVLTGLVVIVAVVAFIWSLSPKLLGFLMVLLSLLVFRYFPRMSAYQPIQFQRGGVLIAILFLVIGLIFILFF